MVLKGKTFSKSRILNNLSRWKIKKRSKQILANILAAKSFGKKLIWSDHFKYQEYHKFKNFWVPA